jgi:uncharacterized membrane protein
MSESQNARSAIQPTATTNQTGNWIERHPQLSALVVIALGFALRVRAAYGTFLNPDEALHYFISNRSSWSEMYHASLTMAHPPLLFALLYMWRHVGSSEFVLRLPSILAGTAFCWVFFRWMLHMFGLAPAWIGLTWITLLPPMVGLSAEVRQYEPLLLFSIFAAYLLEIALAHQSAGWMLASFLCLYLAMLSHYSGFLFVAAMGIYSLFRIHEANSGVRFTWIAGEAGALGLAIALYVSHIARIKNTVMAQGAFETWLYKSYFHRGQSLVLFVFARGFSVFQYIFGQRLIGIVMAFFFVAGVVLLLRKKIPLPNSRGSGSLLAGLLVLPFAINCASAVFDAYPYGGTRHSVFLAIFAVAGAAVFVAKLARQQLLGGVGIAIVIVLLCWVFPSIYHPYIARADQNKGQMLKAVTFIENRIPGSDPIFVDYETGILLGHYLCAQQPISYDNSLPGFLVFHCGGHRIISTEHDLWFFTPQNFANEWGILMGAGQFQSGDSLWVAQAGFNVTIANDIWKEPWNFPARNKKMFGNNIVLFRLITER